MNELKRFNLTAGGLALLYHWRENVLPCLRWGDLVGLVIKEYGNFDDFLFDFATGQVFLVVGDYFDVHVYLPKKDARN